jgi:hypothetical protein
MSTNASKLKSSGHVERKLAPGANREVRTISTAHQAKAPAVRSAGATLWRSSTYNNRTSAAASATMPDA